MRLPYTIRTTYEEARTAEVFRSQGDIDGAMINLIALTQNELPFQDRNIVYRQLARYELMRERLSRKTGESA